MRKMTVSGLLVTLSLFVGYLVTPPKTISVNKVFLPIVENVIESRVPVENGAAWAWGQIPSDQTLLNIQWWYNYGVTGNSRVTAEFVPFLWCDRWPPHDYANGRDYFQLWRDNNLTSYKGYALILNEPELGGSDTGGQCNRTPKQAAYIYKQALTLCPLCVWVGPNISHIDYQNDWAWLRQFYNYLMGWRLPLPRIAGVHTYMGENPQLIINSLFNMLAQYPNSATTVWVTEYGNANPNTITAMLTVWQNDPRVTRWAYFAPRIPVSETSLYPLTLVDPAGQLTAVGQAYLAKQRR